VFPISTFVSIKISTFACNVCNTNTEGLYLAFLHMSGHQFCTLKIPFL